MRPKYQESIDSTISTLMRRSLGTNFSPNIFNFHENYRQSASNGERISVNRTPIFTERTPLDHLKHTLNSLEQIVRKAEKDLRYFRNIISEETEEQGDRTYQIERRPEKVHYQQNTNRESWLSNPHMHKKQNYYINELISAVNGQNATAYEHLLLSMKVLGNFRFIQLPTLEELAQHNAVLVQAKEDQHKKTLILDIDETIVHCEQTSQFPHDIVLKVKIADTIVANAYVSIRPYAMSFLRRMSKHYEIICFTAGRQSYADMILDEIDPQHKYIKHRLYRDNCILLQQGIYCKDLRVVNRDLSKVVMVDNSPYSYLYQPQNGVPILPYYYGEDKQLQALQKYLEQLAKQSDIRTLNRETFKLEKYGDLGVPKKLVQELYLKL